MPRMCPVVMQAYPSEAFQSQIEVGFCVNHLMPNQHLSTKKNHEVNLLHLFLTLPEVA